MKHINQWAAAMAAVTAAAASMFSAGAWAHHSFAMFDRSRTVTISGTIKNVEWTNPHIWVWVSVPKAGGGEDVYALESGGPSQMQRMGASYSDFKAGKKITAIIYPMKDGRLGGQPKIYQFQDGTQFNVDQAVQKFASGG